MTEFRDRLERELMAAHRGVLRRHRRRRLGTAVMVATALSSTAYAAVELWRPDVGDDQRGRPTVTADAPPSRQIDMFESLRRPSSPEDRGPQVQKALQLLTPDVAGVRTDYVRMLETDGFKAVLIPVARFNLRHNVTPRTPPSLLAVLQPQQDGLCLFFPDDSWNGGGFGCATTDWLESGRIAATSGRTLYGLVPDSVAQVAIELKGGGSVLVEPSNNFYATTVAAGDGSATAERTYWYDSDGNLVGEAHLGP